MSLTQLNTEQLIAKCREKNQSAQLETYNRYYKTMYNTALRIVRDTAEAEDIMQEAFLKAFTKLPMLENNALFGPWLKRIVINDSLTISRKNNITREVDIDNVMHIVTDDDTTEEECWDSTEVNSIRTALTQLKDNYSTILSLHYIEGYEYDEICQILNISYSNCRTLLSRAKESLRKKITRS